MALDAGQGTSSCAIGTIPRFEVASASSPGRLLAFPPGVVKRRAQQLGLAHPVANRKDWTPEETDFLMWNCGEKTSKWISNKLGRSETSVVLKCRRMQISRTGEGRRLHHA